MAASKEDSYPGSVLQPTPKIIENQPASSVSEALKNAQAQYDKSKAKQ